MSLNGRACKDEASGLLPWYLNGSLEGVEEARVRAHLEACSLCSEELAQLAEMARSLAAGERWHEEVSRPAPPRRGWMRPFLATAAMLFAFALVATLAKLEKGRQRGGGAPAPEGREALLDLGAGLPRGRTALPRIALSGNESHVTVSFLAPVTPGASYEIAVRDGEGRTLARRDRGPLALDSSGRAHYVLAAPGRLEPGDYYLDLKEFAGEGEVREYIYPFLITRSRKS